MPDEPLRKRVVRFFSSGGAEDWLKVFAFVLVWAMAVVIAVSFITVSSVHDPRLWKQPEYTLKYGYTYSLVLVLLPLLGLAWWYRISRKSDTDGRLKALIKAVLVNAAIAGVVLVVFDIVFAMLLFEFPHQESVIGRYIWGYTWQGECSTIWTIYRLSSCYDLTIPIEEVAFYVGGAAVLRGMYIWASEDFLDKYTIAHDHYVREAKATAARGLVSINWRVLALMVALLVGGYTFKHYWGGGGFPVYLFLQILIVASPLTFLYTRVRPFINTRALLMVMVLQVLVSVIWEATAALPYGWWDYRREYMIGSFVYPWAKLPIEACFFWVAVGWSAMFLHEAMKIKVRAGRSWRFALFGDPIQRAADPERERFEAADAGRAPS